MCAPAVCSELAALAQQLAALAPALATAVTAAATVADLDSPGHIQSRMACMVTSLCISLGHQLQLKGSDALRVAAAARLLLLAGRAVILADADTARRCPAVPRRQHILAGLLLTQLSAMGGCMALVKACERADAVAVFAATTAATGVLLAWLAAVTDNLLLAPRSQPPGTITWLQSAAFH